MFENICKKCENRMVIDITMTARSYNKDTGKIINEEGDAVICNMPDYVILRCIKCNNMVKRSIEDLINEFKFSFMRALIDVRQIDANNNLDTSILREESGLSYCGYCPGPFEADGYCLNDVKEQCVVRKSCIDRENGKI